MSADDPLTVADAVRNAGPEVTVGSDKSPELDDGRKEEGYHKTARVCDVRHEVGRMRRLNGGIVPEPRPKSIQNQA